RPVESVGVDGVSGLAKLLKLPSSLLKLVQRFELHFLSPQFRGGKRAVYRPPGRTRNKPVLLYRHSGILAWASGAKRLVLSALSARMTRFSKTGARFCQRPSRPFSTPTRRNSKTPI